MDERESLATKITKSHKKGQSLNRNTLATRHSVSNQSSCQNLLPAAEKLFVRFRVSRGKSPVQQKWFAAKITKRHKKAAEF